MFGLYTSAPQLVNDSLSFSLSCPGCLCFCFGKYGIRSYTLLYIERWWMQIIHRQEENGIAQWGSPSASDPRAKNTGQRATIGTVLTSQSLSPLVRLSSLGQHVGVLALAGYKRRKSALTAGPIGPISPYRRGGRVKTQQVTYSATAKVAGRASTYMYSVQQVK